MHRILPFIILMAIYLAFSASLELSNIIFGVLIVIAPFENVPVDNRVAANGRRDLAVPHAQTYSNHSAVSSQ